MCDTCFKHKIKSIQFSAGAKTYPKNYYDQGALDQINMTKEGNEERLEMLEGVDLRWRTEHGKRVPYAKDKVGDYVKADERTMDRVVYGSKRNKADSG